MIGENNQIKINSWLLPFSWVFGLVVKLRNHLFDTGVLKQHSFTIPIISVGNVTVGGTGKTPHVEYLIRLLENKVKVAVLSRGYKRKSEGYVLADKDTTMAEIGDEPFQMKQKFPGIYVAVDAKRVEGINRLTSDKGTKDVDVILLDDAYQHRYVKPGINILLIDYHRLLTNDALLPAGRLREPKSATRRADMVIVTKCPNNLKPVDFRVLTKSLSLLAYQELYFTTLEYGDLMPLFRPQEEQRTLRSIHKNEHILLLTGIASPKLIHQEVKKHSHNIEQLTFADHHSFTDKDVENINLTFEQMAAPKIIITTEKDAARLLNLNGLSPEVKESLYSLPITVKFMLEQEKHFNSKILSYVEKNSKNSILAKGKDDHKPKGNQQSDSGIRTISFKSN